jgi:hypothetical protein
MRLVSVTVRNYRIHKDRTVRFDPSLTVIGGPNESGKSTIVEAVHRALFLRSRVTGAVLETMRSEFHPGHPSIELTFASGGSTYTITKQFTGSAAAPTTLAQEGRPTLRNEEAEDEIHRILKAESVGGGRGLEDRLRMQWSHLWVWQGEAGAEPLAAAGGSPMDRLHQRLSGLEGGDVLESALDTAVARQVLETHAGRTKDDGSPRAGSPLAAARAEVAAAATALAAAEAAVDGLCAAVAAVEAADATIAECDASLASTRTEQQQLRERSAEVARLDVLLAQQVLQADAAAGDLRAVEAADLEIEACEREIATLEAARTPAADRLDAAIRAEAACAERFEAAVRQARVIQRTQTEMADRVERVALCEHVERRRTDRMGLAGRCAKIAELRAEVAALSRRLHALPVVAVGDVADLAALERHHDAAQATVDAIATRVELLAADREVVLGDRPLVAGMAETITADTELVVGDAARLRIAPGGTTLIEATRRRDDAREALASRLAKLGAASLEEARRTHLQRQELEADIKGKQTAIVNLGDTQADDDLRRTDAEIAELDAQVDRAAPHGFIRPDGLEAALCAKHEVDVALDALGDEAARANAEFEAADRLRGEAGAARKGAEESIRTGDDQLRNRKGRLEVLLEKHGVDRAPHRAALRTASDAAVAALAATRKRLAELEPETLDRTGQRLERAGDMLLKRKQAAETERQLALVRLRHEGTVDPNEDLARVRARDRLAAAHDERAAREARAYGLLALLFTEKKREVESQFVGPLTTRVAEYLRCIYGPDTQVAVDYRDGSFRDLSVSRPALGNASFGFARISGGSREQVAAAFRLAMAEILAADHDGCLPIVFDDAFVNSDPVRVRGLQGMLDLAAARGLQVVVLSCNHRAYDTLGAAVVELSTADVSGAATRQANAAGEPRDSGSGAV